ncbi:hypothetical protein CR513_04335, partial [Mucuna pruriens]
MYQGSKSIEEYYKDMEVALLRANVLESNEATMTQFLYSLNREIQDMLEFYHYASLDDLPQRRTTPMVLVARERRKERKNGPKRTRVQRRGVPHHEAERKNIHHQVLVPRPKAVALSASSAWGKGTLPPNAPIK